MGIEDEFYIILYNLKRIMKN